MTTHEQALRALAQAYDREDAAQRGEPDPWNLDDPGDIGDSDTWVSERLACAQVAAEAFLSALLPEDVAGLVERLRQYEGRQWETTACYNGTRDEAASLIQWSRSSMAEIYTRAADRARLARGAAERIANAQVSNPVAGCGPEDEKLFKNNCG